MTTIEVGQNCHEAGQVRRPKRRPGKIRGALTECLRGALHGAFAPWRGGSKALAAAVEKDPRSAHRYLAGHAVPNAVDLLMVLLRCPHFAAELRERLHRAGEPGGLLDSLKAKAIGRARKMTGKLGALRLRFRRRRAA